MGTCVHFSRSLPSNSWWQRWLGARSCQGRQPPKAGAAGQPLQDLPPSHTRPPRSAAGNSSAGCLKTGPQYKRDSTGSGVSSGSGHSGSTTSVLIEVKITACAISPSLRTLLIFLAFFGCLADVETFGLSVMSDSFSFLPAALRGDAEFRYLAASIP